MDETSDGKPQFRSSIMKNLYEMYFSPLIPDNEMLAVGERNLTLVQKTMSSFIGSMITALVVTPFDVVKIRLQAQQRAREHLINPEMKTFNDIYLYRNGLMEFLCECNYCQGIALDKPQAPWRAPFFIQGTADARPRRAVGITPAVNFTGTIDAFKKIMKFEGITSLWSGLSPTLFLSLPLTVMYFPLYDKMKYSFGFNPEDTSTWYAPPLAGALCRTIVVFLFNPLEMFKTKLQSEKITNEQFLQAVKTTFSHRGYSFLFGGLFPSLYRDVPFSAIYWFMYELLKLQFTRIHDRPRPNLWDSLVAGAISGSAAAITTLPFDVVKTHRQVELGQTEVGDWVKRPSTLSMLKELYRRSGFKGLYAGAVPRMVKVAPACAIMISCYEGLKTFFIKYNCQRDMSRPTEGECR